MKKQLILIPVYRFPGMANSGLFDRFLSLIDEALKKLGATSSNSLFISPNPGSYSSQQDSERKVYDLRWIGELLSRKYGFMTYSSMRPQKDPDVTDICKKRGYPNQGVLKASLFLFVEGVIAYANEHTTVPNIIIPIDYETLCWLLEYCRNREFSQKLETMSQMGFVIALKPAPEDREHSEQKNKYLEALRFYSRADSLVEIFFKKEVLHIETGEWLPNSKVVLPSWLKNDSIHSGLDTPWFDTLVWQLVHYPACPENTATRKDIFEKLRAKAGYVGVFDEELAPVLTDQ